MNIDEMQAGREMNELITVHVMGFKHYIGDEIPSGHEHIYLGVGEIPEIWLKEFPKNDFQRYCKQCGDMPDWSGDIAAVYEMEEKIKEMGDLVQAAYATELRALVGVWGFNLIHATPEQRCIAALKALGVS